MPRQPGSATISNGFGSADRRRFAGRIAVWCLVALAAALLLHAVADTYRRPTFGFVAYYTSSWLAVRRDGIEHLYDNRWFIDQVPRAGISEPRDIFNINPPTTALLFVPIVWLSPATAKAVSTLANLAFLVLTLVVLRRTLPLAFPAATANPYWFPAICGLALVAHPIQENLQLGQAYGLMLLLATVGFSGFVRGDDRKGGLALGAMLALKTSGTLLWVAPLMERRVRTLAWGAVTVAAGVLASLPLLGVRIWWEYPQWIPSLFDQPWSGVVAYQTFPSLAHHLTSREPRFSPHPPLDAAWLASPLSSWLTVVCVTAALFALWPLARDLPPARLRAMQFAGLLALSVPAQPVGEDYHYAVLFPAICVALLAAVEEAPGTRRTAMLPAAIAGTLLVIAPLAYESPRLVDGWASLLAYPRVYGAVLACGSLVLGAVSHPETWRQPAVQPAME